MFGEGIVVPPYLQVQAVEALDAVDAGLVVESEVLDRPVEGCSEAVAIVGLRSACKVVGLLEGLDGNVFVAGANGCATHVLAVLQEIVQGLLQLFVGTVDFLLGVAVDNLLGLLDDWLKCCAGTAAVEARVAVDLYCLQRVPRTLNELEEGVAVDGAVAEQLHLLHAELLLGGATGQVGLPSQDDVLLLVDVEAESEPLADGGLAGMGESDGFVFHLLGGQRTGGHEEVAGLGQVVAGLQQLSEVVGARFEVYRAVDACVLYVGRYGLHLLALPSAKHQRVVAGIAVDAVLRVAVGHLDGVVLHRPVLGCAEAVAHVGSCEVAGFNELCRGDVSVVAVGRLARLVAAFGEQRLVGFVQLRDNHFLVGLAVAEVLAGFLQRGGKGVESLLAEASCVVARRQSGQLGLVALNNLLQRGRGVGTGHEGNLEDGCNVVGLHAGQRHRQPVDGLGVAHLAMSQQQEALHLAAVVCRALAQALEGERLAGRPAHDGGIEHAVLLHVAHVGRRVVVALVEALGAQRVGGIGQRALAEGFPGTGAVDALRVDVHPRLDAGEDGLLLVVDGAVAAHRDREQQVAVLRDNVDQHVDHLLGTLVAIVAVDVHVVVPRADAGAGLPVFVLYAVGYAALHVP